MAHGARGRSGDEPPRIDSATSLRTGAGWNTTNPPFTSVRWKPQVTATMSYYVPNKAGSHDWKLGFDWQIDSSQYGSNSNSGPIRYFDNSQLGRPANVDEIALFSVPENGQVGADNRNQTTAFFAQDTWSLNDRLTLNLGFRFGRQRAYYMSSELTPYFSEFFPTGTIESQTLVTWNNFAPRLGLTYDLTGQGKTVLKAHYGRYYNNIADTLSPGNPANVASDPVQVPRPERKRPLRWIARARKRRQPVGTVGSSIADAAGNAGQPRYEAGFRRRVQRLGGARDHDGHLAPLLLRPQAAAQRLRPLEPGPADSAPRRPGIPCGDSVFPCPIDRSPGRRSGCSASPTGRERSGSGDRHVSGK